MNTLFLLHDFTDNPNNHSYIQLRSSPWVCTHPQPLPMLFPTTWCHVRHRLFHRRVNYCMKKHFFENYDFFKSCFLISDYASSATPYVIPDYVMSCSPSFYLQLFLAFGSTSYPLYSNAHVQLPAVVGDNTNHFERTTAWRRKLNDRMCIMRQDFPEIAKSVLDDCSGY